MMQLLVTKEPGVHIDDISIRHHVIIIDKLFFLILDDKSHKFRWFNASSRSLDRETFDYEKEAVEYMLQGEYTVDEVAIYKTDGLEGIVAIQDCFSITDY